MSLDNARKFYEKVKLDQGLQQKIAELAKENPQEIGTIILKTAKENGFEFTAEEMQSFLAEESKNVNHDGELTDSDLESVAGGGKFEKVASWVFNSVASLGIKCAISVTTNYKCGTIEF